MSDLQIEFDDDEKRIIFVQRQIRFAIKGPFLSEQVEQPELVQQRDWILEIRNGVYLPLVFLPTNDPQRWLLSIPNANLQTNLILNPGNYQRVYDFLVRHTTYVILREAQPD